MDESFYVPAVTATLHTCDICSYETNDKSNFRKHVKRRHTGPTNQPPPDSLICDTCGKMYKTKYGLDLHNKNKHSLQYKHVCNVCQKGYNQKVQFRFHIASHAKLPLNKCRFCKVEFYSHGSLKRHLESCQGKDHRFVCDVCQLTFTRRYQLVEHVRGKHEAPRYVCPYKCGKRFNWRSSVKHHSKICANIMLEL